MPKTNDNVQGAECGKESDRLTPPNPDQLDLQLRTPKIETTSSSENMGTGTMNPALRKAINRPSTAYNPNGGFPRTVNPGLVTIPKHRNQTNVPTYVENTTQSGSGSGFTTIDIYPPEKKKFNFRSNTSNPRV